MLTTYINNLEVAPDTNKGKRIMKKALLTIAIVAVATLSLTGCAKEPDLSGYATVEQLNALQQQFDNMEQTKLYQFTVTFPAVTDAYFSEVRYTGLSGKLRRSDALLLYMSWDGEWMQMPFCYGNNTLNYLRTDDGMIDFAWGRSLYQTFTQEAMTPTIRAIVIPSHAINAKAIEKLSYDEAMTMAGLTESDIIAL